MNLIISVNYDKIEKNLKGLKVKKLKTFMSDKEGDVRTNPNTGRVTLEVARRNPSSSGFGRLKAVLERSNYHSNISKVAGVALASSIDLRKKYAKAYSLQSIDAEINLLDMTKSNISSIKKRGNLKVYHGLPKGIKVVAG